MRPAGEGDHLGSALEGVEPTNNHAERVQRRAVIWRKKSFGCQSPVGCRFVERILMVVQTLRLQNRNTLELLGQTIAAPPTRTENAYAMHHRMNGYFGAIDQTTRRFSSGS